MSRTSKLLLGMLASMMVWSLVGADELDLAKQQDRAGFGPATRQVVDAQALQSVGARCRVETDAAVAAAVAAAADVAAVAAAGDAVGGGEGLGGCAGSGGCLARSECASEEGEASCRPRGLLRAANERERATRGVPTPCASLPHIC
jgi:hypothetical protein